MRLKLICVALLIYGVVPPALAGIYGDDLTRCLIERSSKSDHEALVQWLVVAILQHPTVAPLGKTTAADIDKANTAVGDLLMRLLTDACLDQTKKAIKYEPTAIQAAFAVLGQVAAADIFADAHVKTVMSGVKDHIDNKKLEALKE